MRDEPHGFDHVERFGQGLAREHEHVAARLDAGEVVRTADLRRGGGGDERDRAVGIVQPLVGRRAGGRGNVAEAAVAEPRGGTAVAVEVP